MHVYYACIDTHACILIQLYTLHLLLFDMYTAVDAKAGTTENEAESFEAVLLEETIVNQTAMRE